MHKLLLVLTAAATTFARPNGSPSTTSSASYTAITQVSEFDNLQGVVETGVGPVGSNGIAYNLLFGGFSLVATTSPNSIPAGLTPNSAPNAIAFSLTDPQTVDDCIAQISVDYQDSQIAFFNLDYFYYGCSLATAAAVAGVITSCNITVTGFSPPPASQQVAQQTFAFVASGLQQNMDYAELDGNFKGLYNAVFTVVNANALETNVTAAIIDTVKNVIYSTNLVAGSPKRV